MDSPWGTETMTRAAHRAGRGCRRSMTMTPAKAPPAAHVGANYHFGAQLTADEKQDLDADSCGRCNVRQSAP